MKTTDTNAKIIKLALIGEITIAVALILLLAVAGGIFTMAMMDQDFARLMLRDAFSGQYLPDPTDVTLALGGVGKAQTLGAIVLGFAPNLIGAAMLFYAWRLFHGFRRDGVFTQKAGARLRLMGGLLLILVPVSMVSELAVTALVAMYSESGQRYISVSFDEGDIYAVTIGLTILAVGHIVAQAAQLADENRSFV